MLAAFVPAGFPAGAAPAPALRAAGRGPAADPLPGLSPLLAVGVPLAAAGAAVVGRGQPRQRAVRVAAAAGWKPDPERIGATLPLANPAEGVMMWDPAGFCKDGTQETFDKYREAEVKHGRVAMMATVGMIAQHYVHIGSFVTPTQLISMADVPNGVFALQTPQGSQGFAILVLLAGIAELGVLKTPAGQKPWEFGDPAGWKGQLEYMDVGPDMMKTFEIEHGRLAMFCMVGILSSEYVSGYDAVDQWANWSEALSRTNSGLFA